MTHAILPPVSVLLKDMLTFSRTRFLPFFRVLLFTIVLVGLPGLILPFVFFARGASSAELGDWPTSSFLDLFSLFLFIAFFLWLVLIALLSSIVLTRLSFEGPFEGVRKAFREAWKDRQLVWKLLGASLLSGLLLIPAFLLFVIPGIYLAVAFSFVCYVVVKEGLRPVAAIKRSLELVRHCWWVVAFRLAVFSVLVMMLSFIPRVVDSLWMRSLVSTDFSMEEAGVFLLGILASIVVGVIFIVITQTFELVFNRMVYERLVEAKAKDVKASQALSIKEKIAFVALIPLVVLLLSLTMLFQARLFDGVPMFQGPIPSGEDVGAPLS